MANANIVDRIGSTVTIWTKDGNAAENRKLHTVDEFGIVVSNQHGKLMFVPWVQVKYVDYHDDSLAKQAISCQTSGGPTSYVNG
ncbi:hypothetical protein NSS79_15370 [Paenibacillus sp. FSL L8-0436]|uniref:hypothetical protein n=1 Tax=Paenibacillus sp. FSL L8-0436 TaxID=2954686 RepID=UPI003158917B